MIKKFVSMTVAVLLMVTGISLVGATSAVAATTVLLKQQDSNQTTLTLDTNFSTGVTSYAATATVTTVYFEINFNDINDQATRTCNGGSSSGGQNPCTLNSGSNTIVLTIDPNGADPAVSYTFTVTYTPPVDNDATLASGTVKGVAISSLGTAVSSPTGPNSFTSPGSVTMTSTQAFNMSNGGATFVQNASLSGTVVVKKFTPSSGNFTSTSFDGFVMEFSNADMLVDGDYLVVKVTARNGTTVLYYRINITVTSSNNNNNNNNNQNSGPAPANSPSIGSITSSGAVVNFSAGAAANPSISSWNVKVASGSNCATPVQTISVSSPAVTATITGLSSGTTYRVCVQEPVTSLGFSPSVTFTTLSSSSSPTLTAAEIEAAAVAAAKAAAEAAAAVRAAEIATAQTALATVLKGDKAGTLSEYRSANINITTTAALTRLNAEVLKLSAADRADFAKIKAIADKIEFDESFFNATARPTTTTYSSYGVVGVTERILPTINAKVLELPATARLDVKAIQEIAKVESFVDRVANTETRSTVSATALVEKGLLPATSPYKYSVVQGLAKYPEGSLNTMAKIEAAIKEQVAKAEAPKLRLAAIKAKIAARKK